MTEMVETRRPVISSWKVHVLGGLASLAGLVGLASAATLNESIAPILTSVTELFTPLLNLVLGAVPIIIAISVIGFVLGIFSAILGKMHV